MTPKAVKVEDGPLDNRRDIHDFFELTYANWLTLPRTLLQSMPDAWQKDFVELLGKFDEEMGWAMHLLQATNVQVLKRSPELIEDREDCEACGGEGFDPNNEDEPCSECDGECSFEGESRYETPEEVGEVESPIPHYQRGRTKVPMASDEVSGVLHSHMSMIPAWMKANHKDAWREIYGPEYDPGDEVRIARHTFNHALPPVLDEVGHLGYFDGTVVNAVEGSNNSLYLVMAKKGAFPEDGEVQVQLHADQLRKAS